jgi:hypothetical protein
VREGNVYGGRHPVDILRDPKGKAHTEPEPQPSSPEPSGSSENSSPPAAETPDKHSPAPKVNFDVPPVSPTSSEEEIEKGLGGMGLQGTPDQALDPDSDSDSFCWGTRVECICWEGGVQMLSFLLSCAISPITAPTTDPKTWGYKDAAHLPEPERKEWQDACF